MIEFSFRVWVHPDDPADVEVWWHGIEPTESGKWFASDWALNSMYEWDFHELFELDKDKHWQVVGKGRLHGRFDYLGEYHEEFDVTEFQKAEVPEAWFDVAEDEIHE